MTQALYTPRPANVRADAVGRPVAIDHRKVEVIREEWLVEDRWWTPKPVSRRYFELVVQGGRCEVVFSEGGRWLSQRA